MSESTSTDTPTSPKPRSRRILKILLLQAVFLVLGIFALEFGYRGWLGAQGTPFDPELARQAILARASVMRDGKENPIGTQVEAAHQYLHPYLGYDSRGAHVDFDEEIGYFRSAKSKKNFDIIIMGGSVAAGFGGSHGVRAIKRVLMQDERYPAERVRVFNHGRGGYKQPQQVLLLTYLLGLGYQPDAIINLDGFNEVAIGNQNGDVGTHPLHPATGLWTKHAKATQSHPEAFDLLLDLRLGERRSRELADRSIELGFHNSAILTRLTNKKQARLLAESAAIYERYTHLPKSDDDHPGISGPAVPADPKGYIPLSVQGWFNCSRSMQALCDERGIVYLHALQPTLYDEGSKPLTETEIEKATFSELWVEGVHRGYPLLRKAGAALVEMGVNYHDSSMVFAEVTDELYYDGCHFVGEGNTVLGLDIGAALLELLQQKSDG